MSRNFELLQNIGKEQEYFRPDQERPLRETIPDATPMPEPERASESVSETVFTAVDAMPEPAPSQIPVPANEPLQFAMESSQLAELTKMVQKVFLMPGSEYNHTVIFTSSDEGNGVSWICARVAELLASQITGTVCVVDANLQSPTLHEQFGVGNHHGLSDALRQTGTIRGYVSQLSRRNLALVSCGSDAKDSQGLVTTDRMRMRLNELRAEFDYVLIDCPSTNVSNVAMSLGSVVDGVVLVLKANATRKDKAREAVRDLQAAKVKVLGAVLNQRTFPIPDKIYNKL
jgi:Mrp family chromosome partitioning ATPase